MDVEMEPETSVRTAAPADATKDRSQAVAALERQLAATPKAANPYQHAGIAYRLGLAYAESASAAGDLRKALACYDLAASIFDPRYDPIPHARVLNAAGAAHRALGDRRKAADLFEKSAKLLDGQERDDERAAALNNLGLVRTELGQPALAVAACDEALLLFDESTDEGLRGKAAALHTRGMARSMSGTEDDLTAAIADYDEALGIIARTEAPFHFATIHQAAGVAKIGLARLKPERADRLLLDAVGSISEALTVFSRTAFPYQYALCKNNLGLALQRRALMRSDATSVQGLRRALACFEEAVAVLDPRMYAAEWKQGYANLEQVQQNLSERGLSGSRVEHFAQLLAFAEDDLRQSLLRERLTRILLLPDPGRHATLVEMDRPIALLDYDQARAVMLAEISVLMELPGPDLQAGLEARFQANRSVADQEQRDSADRALDQAVSDALGGPQRMYVRDFLYGLGWERP